MLTIIVPSDILIACVLLLFLCGTIAVVVVVWLDPKDGDDLDEEEDASVDGGDDAQHLNGERNTNILIFTFWSP